MTHHMHMQRNLWQKILSESITSFAELCELLELDESQFEDPILSNTQFSLRVPKGFIDRMKKKSPTDPLLLQVLPQTKELQQVPGYTQDPLFESQNNPMPGLFHKYHGRVLLTIAGACAINCRYCFRRHFPYEKNILGEKDWANIREYLLKNNSIEEVILSGGDPLLFQDHQLQKLLKEIENIPNVQRIRFHTRFPVVIPERITAEFIELTKNTRLQTVIVMHCNHANEIDSAVKSAFRNLRDAGITLLNQSVLLKGVNDSVEDLVQLSKALFEAGCLPYYLNLLDRVNGSAHFEISDTRSQELYQGLLEKLPGYLVPKLVREVAGVRYKVPLSLRFL